MLSDENFIQNKNCICGKNYSFRMRRKTYLNVAIRLAQHEIQLAFI